MNRAFINFIKFYYVFMQINKNVDWFSIRPSFRGILGKNLSNLFLFKQLVVFFAFVVFVITWSLLFLSRTFKLFLDVFAFRWTFLDLFIKLFLTFWRFGNLNIQQSKMIKRVRACERLGLCNLISSKTINLFCNQLIKATFFPSLNDIFNYPKSKKIYYCKIYL